RQDAKIFRRKRTERCSVPGRALWPEVWRKLRGRAHRKQWRLDLRPERSPALLRTSLLNIRQRSVSGAMPKNARDLPTRTHLLLAKRPTRRLAILRWTPCVKKIRPVQNR